MYYKFIPIWKDNSRPGKWGEFIGDNSIVNTKFASISDGLEAARLDRTCLREQNWEILECNWLTKKRIMLKTLYERGYLSDKIDNDNISEIYNFKNK